MKALKKSSSLLIALAMLLSFVSFNALAVTNKNTSATKSIASSKDKKKDEQEIERNKDKFNEIISSFNNPNGRLMSVAHKGNWRNFPENSLEGIKSCIDMGVDIVEVDIQRTKDGRFVLMSDNNLNRMCITKDGKDATSKVSEETLDEIKSYYYLRNSRGGVNSKSTRYTVPSLEEAISLCKDNVMIMIDNAWKYGDQVQSIVKSLDADALVILRGATTPEDISTYIQKNELPISHICGYYTGIMSSPAKNYVKETISAGAKIIELASENSYSSLYKKSVLSKFENNGRAFISTTKPSHCGDREDLVRDWDDLVNRGYSVIETNFPEELVYYIKEVENNKVKLSSLITQAQGLNTSNYSRSSAKELKKALEEAEESSSDGSTSLNNVDLVRYNLQKAIDNMKPRGENEKDGVGAGTIVALTIIVIVIFAGIFLFIRKNKRRKRPSSPPPYMQTGANGNTPNGTARAPQQRPIKRRKIRFGKKNLKNVKKPIKEKQNPPTNPK